MMSKTLVHLEHFIGLGGVAAAIWRERGRIGAILRAGMKRSSPRGLSFKAWAARAPEESSRKVVVDLSNPNTVPRPSQTMKNISIGMRSSSVKASWIARSHIEKVEDRLLRS